MNIYNCPYCSKPIDIGSWSPADTARETTCPACKRVAMIEWDAAAARAVVARAAARGAK